MYMRRREFNTLLGGAAAWPFAARAQTARIPRIGVLWHAASADEEKEYLPVLSKAFNDLGYVEGRNIALDHRFPSEQPERFRLFAQEFVEGKVDAIVAVTLRGAMEAKQATSTIPIVVVVASDPVGAGLVDSLARPGGNITGLSLMGTDLSGKCLALLKEAVPSLSRLVFLVDPTVAAVQKSVAAYRDAADALKLSLRPVEVPTPTAIEPAFLEIVRDGFDGVVVGPGSMLFNERARLGSSALAHKLPTFVSIGEMVPYGPLMSYGQDFLDYFRRAAAYVDKILKGARPADLPVEQPTHLKLVLNLKTAKALSLTLPPTLLATADEVIE
jgi:putative ABC transport system substrate-binding protein